MITLTQIRIYEGNAFWHGSSLTVGSWFGYKDRHPIISNHEMNGNFVIIKIKIGCRWVEEPIHINNPILPFEFRQCCWAKKKTQAVEDRKRVRLY